MTKPPKLKSRRITFPVGVVASFPCKPPLKRRTVGYFGSSGRDLGFSSFLPGVFHGHSKGMLG
jgi:hypothetical protein